MACNLTTDQSTALKLTNGLLHFWAERESLFTTKESAVCLFSSCPNPPIVTYNIMVCNHAGRDKKKMDFKRKGELQGVYCSLELYFKNKNVFRKTLYICFL